MPSYNKKTLEDIDVAGKKVLVRVDFNVPLDENLKVTDDTRIVGALKTIQYLVDHKARVILVSHLGRPKNGFENKFSMKPAVERLAELLHKPVTLAKDVIGEDAKAKAAALKDGEVLMLENVRFHQEEEKNDPGFAKELASLAEIYVNDAFGTAHRAHASTEGVTKYLPAVCGYLIKKEIDFMGTALNSPERPFVAILGGAKVSDKIKVIENLIDKCDSIVIGGGMAYTFIRAKGFTVGSSLCEEDRLDLAKGLMEKASAKGVQFELPIDSVAAKEFKNDAELQIVSSEAIPDGWMGLDIGPKAIERFAQVISGAKTVVWNGPMGVFEFPNFAAGTKGVAKAVAEAKGTTIIGGGDSVAAVEQLGFADKMSHISTGGGASLEFLEGQVLPGVAALMDKDACLCGCHHGGRSKVVAGNWKMNKTPAESAAFVRELASQVKEIDETEIIVGVPFTSLPAVVAEAAGTNIKVAAQNLHYEAKGAYTGEIAADMLKDLGVDYVIIGHSERRQYFAETDETVNKKVHAALAASLKPIVCVGESLNEREQGITEEVVRRQVKVAFLGITADQAKCIVVAYEPIWAIGTGKTATNEQANEVCHIIRALLCELYGAEVAACVKIQYGGSVTAANAEELFAMGDIDGGLVGGASLKVADFTKIAHS